MPTEIDARITPTLHPDNVASIDGFDEQTAPYLAPTMTAFSTAYEGIRSVHEAREKAKTNPTWNEAHQIIHTDDFAQKHLARITKSFDVRRCLLAHTSSWHLTIYTPPSRMTRQASLAA